MVVVVVVVVEVVVEVDVDVDVVDVEVVDVVAVVAADMTIAAGPSPEQLQINAATPRTDAQAAGGRTGRDLAILKCGDHFKATPTTLP